MTTLREAAQQALEALGLAKLNGKAGLYPAEIEEIADAITALKAALAQPDDWTRCHHCGQTMPPVPLGQEQAEPVQEPYTDDVTRIMREAGMTFHLGLPHKTVVEQMTRVVDLVYAEASIKAAQQFASALAQQAEPAQEPVAWMFTDADNQRVKFLEWQKETWGYSGAWIKTPLYTAPPKAEPAQEPVAWVECDGELVWNNREAAIGRNLYTAPLRRTMVPLTEQEIDHAANNIFTSDPVQWWRRIGRAVEKASWEKNHGQA